MKYFWHPVDLTAIIFLFLNGKSLQLYYSKVDNFPDLQFSNLYVQISDVALLTALSWTPLVLPELRFRQCGVVCGIAKCDLLLHATRLLPETVNDAGCVASAHLAPLVLLTWHREWTGRECNGAERGRIEVGSGAGDMSNTHPSR